MVMQPSASEALLARDVVAATQGDHIAYGRLVDGTRNLVTAISLAIVRDLALSEDVAQEAYLEAWEGLGRLRNPTSFLPWLRQLTRNRAHDQLRRRARQATTALDDEQRDPRPDARTQLIAVEEQSALTAALDELPDSAREVVTLFYREGQSVAQVAALLGMSDLAVKKRLQRARDQLRAATLARLGEALEKSAPAAAFTAAVLGAITAGAPATATAAVIAGNLGKAGSLLAKGPLAATLASAGAGMFAGVLAGGLGVVIGLRKVWRRARDDDERRELLRFGIVNVAITTVGAIAMPLGHYLVPNGIGLILGFALFWIPMTFDYLVWLPRIVARREALERDEDPTAAARQRRERRVSWLGYIGGTLAGGGTVALVVLKLHHII
ncbi:MAG: polymerase ECF-type sigma factor [bacterium]|nr:polymerase ECF-type sigma factor [bacterium]